MNNPDQVGSDPPGADHLSPGQAPTEKVHQVLISDDLLRQYQTLIQRAGEKAVTAAEITHAFEAIKAELAGLQSGVEAGQIADTDAATARWMIRGAVSFLAFLVPPTQDPTVSEVIQRFI